jgi:hypothetical protein
MNYENGQEGSFSNRPTTQDPKEKHIRSLDVLP